MVVFGKGSFFRAEIVVIGQNVVFGQKLLYSGKVVLFWAKVVVFLQIGFIRAKWLCSD